MGATAAITAAVIGAAGTVYAASQNKAPKVARPMGDPQLPNKADLSADMQQADIQARTAGGTILSDPAKNRVGDGANAVRKTLLGT